MKEVAWVGSRRDFDREFHTHNGEFYDKETDIMYYGISTEYNIKGRRFDEVQQGFWGENYNRYNAIYQEIIHTRIKKSGN